MRAIRKYIAWIILIVLFAVGCSSIEKAESLYRQGEKQEALKMAISLMDDDSPKVRLRAVKLVGSIGGLTQLAALAQLAGWRRWLAGWVSWLGGSAGVGWLSWLGA